MCRRVVPGGRQVEFMNDSRCRKCRPRRKLPTCLRATSFSLTHTVSSDRRCAIHKVPLRQSRTHRDSVSATCNYVSLLLCVFFYRRIISMTTRNGRKSVLATSAISTVRADSKTTLPFDSSLRLFIFAVRRSARSLSRDSDKSEDLNPFICR